MSRMVFKQTVPGILGLSGLWLDMCVPNLLPRITKGVEPLTNDSTRDPLTNCIMGDVSQGCCGGVAQYCGPRGAKSD